jgi:SAM-dependent methyltransferase
MPEEPIWEQFFDPVDALHRLGLRLGSQDIVDMGCGYGTFTVAAARLTSGIVHAFDIEPAMLAATLANAERHSLKNVRLTRRDFVQDGTDLPDESIGYVLLFNLLHAEDPQVLLREAFRVLGPGCTLAVMHWISDAPTPRGPPLDIRPRPQRLPALLAAGYRVITYDRRGFGKPSKPTTGYNYDIFAEDLRKLVLKLDLHDVSLVGFSMGGGEVARYLGKYGAKDVSKAVIISGVPPFLVKRADKPEGVDAGVFRN